MSDPEADTLPFYFHSPEIFYFFFILKKLSFFIFIELKNKKERRKKSKPVDAVGSQNRAQPGSLSVNSVFQCSCVAFSSNSQSKYTKHYKTIILLSSSIKPISDISNFISNLDNFNFNHLIHFQKWNLFQLFMKTTSPAPRVVLAGGPYFPTRSLC